MTTFQKYHKVTKEAYQAWYQENAPYRERVAADPNRLRYHLMPETGWLNDPNGLVQIDGVYHIYYQYTPFEPTGELKLWGHYTTRDFIHYEGHEPALFPDQDMDAHGVYSGSAFPENGTVHYFYTGNVKYFDKPDYDYIMAGRGSNTVHITSRDGFHFSPKECLLTTADYPEDISCHVRDPKILKKDGRYYMALGARDQNSEGLVLIYRSDDLTSWSYLGRISAQPPFGYMWECPDLFFLDGELVLICCPQGVAREGINYANVHQCVMMRIDADFEAGRFTVKESLPAAGAPRFFSVDRGCDFYAPQTFLDEKGRRILISWMGIPDADYTNPTTEAGWQHALTLPRELHLEDGHLIQQPLEELAALRRRQYLFASATALNGCGLLADPLIWEAELTFSSCRSMELQLREEVTLSFRDGVLTLDLGKGGSGRGSRSVALSGLEDLRIYSDSSSLEIFVNGGREVFTTRVYAGAAPLQLTGDCEAQAVVYELDSFQIHRETGK